MEERFQRFRAAQGWVDSDAGDQETEFSDQEERVRELTDSEYQELERIEDQEAAQEWLGRL